MDRKYFFFDIDGTIAVGFPRYVPESTRRTLHELIEKGHFVSIATGRMYCMTDEFREMFEITNMVTDGGNGIVIDGVAEVEPLDHSMVMEAVEIFEREGIPWAACLSLDTIWYSKDSTFSRIMEEKKQYKGKMDSQIIEGLDVTNRDVYKLFAIMDRELEDRIMPSNIMRCRYNDAYIIVEQVDKSIGIRKVMDKLGAEDKDVVVFGDNTNDIAMFKPEWTKIAMGNGVPELKAIADFVTTDAEVDGIEVACRHFGWID